ncbi:heavy metal-associated isoprenylated plant protein 32 [Populus alba x Populus x berolinensis]|nr:heavy metal-associated isoprenylated plant protein 32 [Populus alba x Populus x berolinensis]
MIHHLQSCGLKVDTTSPNWHKTLTKVLKRIKGISYSIDAEQGMALITCRVNLNKLIRKLSRVGKHADICWVETRNHQNGYHYHL